MMYERERDNRNRSDREREWEWEREREREQWERERERDRARGSSAYLGGPSSRTAPPPPPPHPNDRRSPVPPFGPPSPSSQSGPRRKWSGSEPDGASAAYHREREWEREREYEFEREREMRWRASQRSAGGPDMPPTQHVRAPSGDMRYALGGPAPGMPGEPSRSPREPYANSLPPRQSPIPGRAGPVGGRAREPSADVPLAAMGGPERSPRHAPYIGGPYDDPRAGSMPPGHGGMLPPAGRSPDRMRAPLSYGPYDGPMSDRELMQRERDRTRDRDMMGGDRYGRRIHGEPMMMDDPYDRHGPRGPPSGPLGPPSNKSAGGRPYDERGPPPPLPYPPASPTQSRDGDRRKEKPKTTQAGANSNPSRESSVPAQSRQAYDRGAGPMGPHFEPERHPRSGPPPPMGTVRESSAKVESRRAPVSPSSERGAPFTHRGPSLPPYGGPPSDRDLALAREREMEAEHERERLRAREREQRERDLELERERLRMEELERAHRERELELERELQEKEREKEKERERRERRREKQQAEKLAAIEREKEREFQTHQAQMHELPPHLRPSLEEALVATAQQQAAVFGRPPNMNDFHAAAQAIGWPPGMPLPPGIFGMGQEAQNQPHVIRDPNAGPRVDSEPVWLYLELCERDESIRRAERLPLDMSEEGKDGVAAPVEAQEQAEDGAEPATEPAAHQQSAEDPQTKALTAEDNGNAVAATPVDPLPRHLIGMDKGRPVRHLGSFAYDPTVDPLFPAELLSRNVGSTLEVRIPGTLLSGTSGVGPRWEEYRSLERECLARCEVGDPLKDLLEGERGTIALNGVGNGWKLGWRGKEHARMSLEMRIEERVAEGQLFGMSLPTARPLEQNKAEADSAESEKGGKGDSPWRFWRLNPLLRRKLWGTDVYTDDSDVLAMCVHAGWVEGPSLESEGIPAWVPPGRAARAWNGLTGHSPPTGSAGSGKAKDGARACDLSVILRIAPKLIAYKGCQRGGIKSRSWGNSHDGVSLVVESVELKQPGYAQAKGRSAVKARIDQLARYRAAVEREPQNVGLVALNKVNEDAGKRLFWEVGM